MFSIISSISSGRRFLPGALICAAFCWFAAVLFPLSACGYYQDTAQNESFIFRTKIRNWLTYGSVKYYLSRLAQTSPKIYYGDTLDYRGLDSSLYLFSAEVRPMKGVSLDFEIGDDRFSNGKVFIHNWLTGQGSIFTFYNGTVWETPNQRDYVKSRAEINGTTRLYSADAYFRIYKTAERALRDGYDLQHSLELFAGYSWYKDRIDISNGFTILSEDIFSSLPQVGPIAGLDSDYNMTWQGWRGGFREQTRLSGTLLLNAKFAFGPTMSYRGQGFWNLGNYWNPDGFNIQHFATGQVVELSGSVEWAFWKRFRLEAGYMGWFYRITSGTQKTFYSDGSQSEDRLYDMNAARKGWFLSLSWQY